MPNPLPTDPDPEPARDSRSAGTRRPPRRATTPHAAIGATLRAVFGFESLRPGQVGVVKRVLRGESTLAVMPTGAGKSLCYQLPAVLDGRRTLVISPLIALMDDQCAALVSRGIPAVVLHSGLPASALQQAEEAVRSGRAGMVFTSPERAAEPGFAAFVAEAGRIGLMVVDEAHCLNRWGASFRPAYLELGPLRRALGQPPVLALTATASADAAADICGQLGIPADGVQRWGVYRPNLHFRVEPMDTAAAKRDRALALVAGTEGTGIVYTSTVREAEAIHGLLVGAGQAAGLYHGRLAARERTSAQEAFMAGALRVMVATPAFGLGIDKPDIRFVLHLQLPPGLDAYYQEAGRAGRDGQDATCTLLYLRADRGVQQFFMAGRYPERDAVEAVDGALRRLDAAGGAASVAAVAAEAQLPQARVHAILGMLRLERLASRRRDGTWRAGRQAMDGRALDRVLRGCEARSRQDRAELEAMVFYAQSGICRWRALLCHFEPDAQHEACGHCDTCERLARLEAQPSALQAADAGTEILVGRLTPGTAVRVKRYGAGEVLSDDGSSVTIRFAGGAERCFHPDFVRPARGRAAARAPAAASP
ncbi:RecQ family ATP-dependent DNA helicase [Aquincola sp. MAHUQ-54]|uniref:ATP-dependent DNA helicase RecQ n=1 Tax=Aquincola agrisoli TaxID=3119538 RepID=A0AAW9QG19_9BURK